MVGVETGNRRSETAATRGCASRAAISGRRSSTATLHWRHFFNGRRPGRFRVIFTGSGATWPRSPRFARDVSPGATGAGWCLALGFVPGAVKPEA